jgi:hypothetical protein
MGLGSIKRWGGGAPVPGALLDIEKGAYKFFPEILATAGGGEREHFSHRHHTIPKLHGFDHFFLKHRNFQTKRLPLMLI